MAHEFPISVADLDAGGRAFRFTVRANWVRGAFEGHEATAASTDGVLAVRASKSGHDVVVDGTLDATLSVPCARCLTPFELPLHSDIQVLYVPASRVKAPAPKKDVAGPGTEKRSAKEKEDEEEYEFTSEEADTLGYDGETVVLDDLVRDELMLEIPMIPLCSEACTGMSPAPGEPQAPSEAGQGQRIDPRLAPLLQFRSRAKEPKS